MLPKTPKIFIQNLKEAINTALEPLSSGKKHVKHFRVASIQDWCNVLIPLAVRINNMVVFPEKLS